MSIATDTNKFCTKQSSKLIPPVTYSELQQTSKMECFATIVKGWKPLPITTRHSTLDISGSPGYTFDIKLEYAAIRWFGNIHSAHYWVFRPGERTKYSWMDQAKFFKGYLPQILLGPFLNTLSQITVGIISFQNEISTLLFHHREERTYP